MKKRNMILFFISALYLMLAACSAPQTNQGEQTQPKAAPVELTVSAAASLTDALTELKPSFEEAHPGTTLVFNFGSSGKLAQQIEQGAPADLFLSASPKDLDGLEQKQLIDAKTRVDFAANSLVLITGKSAPAPISTFEDLANPALAHIAIGEPNSVPAGRYAKETLESLKLWDSVSSRLVYASDVRQVLAFVESGNADAGIVYASDAAISPNVNVLATADAKWHKPIVYPGAVVAASSHADLAKEFLSYLTSENGKAILHKYGFQ